MRRITWKEKITRQRGIENCWREKDTFDTKLRARRFDNACHEGSHGRDHDGKNEANERGHGGKNGR